MAYIHSDIVSREFPGVKVEPVIGNLNLVTVYDFLLEDAVSVPQTVAPGGVAQGSQAVQEARREPAEAAVSEGCVVLLLDDVFDPEAKVGESRFSVLVKTPASGPRGTEDPGHTLCNVLLTDVQDGVIQRSPHEELETEVVHALVVL